MNSLPSNFPLDLENSIVAICGAGISKASGIPTFRDPDGYWSKYDFQELASYSGFINNPELVWEWYAMRIEKVLSVDPNLAHFSLQTLEDNGLLISVVTQNVDGLHARAGNKKLHNIHGDILSARCIDDCGAEDVFWTAPLKEVPPHCDCGAFLRPNVIWFGESLPFQVLDQSLNDIALAKILLVIGTSGVVHPVASFPLMAKRNGSFLIEFNIEPTPLTPLMDLTFFGPVEKTLPEFLKKLPM